MYSDEIQSSELAKKLLVFDLVYLDTCSLMEDSFPLFMDLLVKSRYYWKEKVKVIILPEVYAELSKHASNEHKTHLTVAAKRALKILRHDAWRLWAKTIQVIKNKDNDGFADNAIFTEVSTWRIKKKVLVITQDKKLATDLKKQNSLDSQKGRFVLVYRINQRGNLEENLGTPLDNQSKFKKPNGISSAPIKTAPSKPQHAEKKETAKPSSLQNLVKNDKRIAANLNNGNYPLEKKIKDIEDQIALLSREDKKAIADLKLSYDLEKLNKSLNDLKKPAKVVEKPQQKEKTPAETKQKPILNKESKEIWYEFGSNPFEAAVKACTYCSIIPHKKEVPYSKEGHGEANITIQDLAERIAKFDFGTEGSKLDVKFEGFVIHIEKTATDFKAYGEFVKIKKAEKKPAPKKEKPSKDKEEVKKAPQAPSLKEKAKSSKEDVEAPKTAEIKPIEVKEASKKATPKDESAKAPKKEVVSEELKKALDAERVLKCNVPNPNYPVKNKIADLEAQLERAHALKESERRKLSWGIRELQKRLSELKKA